MVPFFDPETQTPSLKSMERLPQATVAQRWRCEAASRVVSCLQLRGVSHRTGWWGRGREKLPECHRELGPGLQPTTVSLGKRSTLLSPLTCWRWRSWPLPGPGRMQVYPTFSHAYMCVYMLRVCMCVCICVHVRAEVKLSCCFSGAVHLVF